MDERRNTGSTRVLIVGGGPVGLALAIELGHRGVNCRVVERNDRVGYAPRAKTTNVRTREHLRRWGIADRLRAASPLGVDHPSNVVFCTRLAGPEITRFENAFYCAPGRNPLYAEHAQWIPQYTLEEVLREHAQSLPGVTLDFSTEITGLTQETGGVQARLQDLRTGTVRELRADFLVGADGARSFVREAIGAKLEGTYGLSRNYNVVFRAPGLAQRHRLGPAIMYWQVNPDVPSLIGPMDRGDTWFFMPTGVAPDFRLGKDDAPAMLRRATGIDVPYEVLSTDEWVASRFLADSYRSGRVFLAGDACHLHPPFGGYGMNMGIADGVDLGWKLAAVLQGWGGPGLLASYEQERRPVHRMVLEESTANHSVLGNQLWRAGLDRDDEEGCALRASLAARIQAAKTREFTTLGVVRGYVYASCVVVPEVGAERDPDYLNYVPSSRPGALAPHLWMHDGSSLYDHFGSGFTLLAHRATDAREIEAACAEAGRDGVPLRVVQPQAGAARELYPSALTLIRPDQHVAWRGDRWQAGAVRRITGHDVPAETPQGARS